MSTNYNKGALLLCIILSVRMMAIPLLYLDYNLRKDYIVQNLCKNRFRPALHCDGKCYLAKKIAATEQKETTEKGADLAKILFEIPCVVTTPSSFSFDTPLFFQKIRSPFYFNLYQTLFISSLLKPPTMP